MVPVKLYVEIVHSAVKINYWNSCATWKYSKLLEHYLQRRNQ